MDDAISLPDGAELAEFKPCVVYNEEMQLTQILLRDASMVSVPLRIPGVKGHCIDMLYDMTTGELVGMQVWDDVRKQQS